MEMAAGLLFSQTRAVRNAFRLALVLSVASLFAAASPRAVQSTHLKIIVGVTDDTAKWMVRQDGIVGVHRDLRLMAVRVTIPWRPGQVRPTKLQGVYLHRIARMAQLANAFVALPGGIGTLEEVIEIFTWLQLGLHLKPVGLLNARGFYDLLVQFLAHMRDEQFLTSKHHSMLAVSTDAEALLDRLTSTMHVHVPKAVSHAATNDA